MNLGRLKGDSDFYRMVKVLVLPIVVQQGITNFVNLLDNIMIGALGTLPMSGVAIINQLIFVFYLALFGGLSGVSIFGAQFWGVKDLDGMRHTFRFKLVFGVAIIACTCLLFYFKGGDLIMLWLDESVNSADDIVDVLAYGTQYLRIMLFGLPAFMLAQAYINTLRETGETVAPMKASILAVLINFSGNYILIFGHFGFPQLGVAGAAIATVASRWAEAAYIISHAHRHKEKYPFMDGALKSLYVPAALVKKILIKGSPLLFNEMLWAVGSTAINNSYASRGLTVVAASTIAGTAWQFFAVVMFSMGAAVSILVGQKLGAGDIKGAIDINYKLLFLSFILHLGIGLALIAASPFVPMLYKTEIAVRELATKMLIISGLALPVNAMINCAYFAIRSGGKTVITFLFDCGFMWLVSVPLAFFLCRYTAMPIVWAFFIVRSSEVFKLAIALKMLKSGFWAQNIIST